MNPFPHLFISKIPFLISNNYKSSDDFVRNLIIVPLTAEVIESFLKDDLDFFLKLSTQKQEFTDFGFYLEERPNDLYSLVNIAAYFGSVNIFKYCISNQTKVNILPQFPIAGGSKEILNICEQRGINLVAFSVIALLYRRDDIYDWLVTKTKSNIPNSLYNCTETYSIKKFYQFCQLNKKVYNNHYILSFLIENMKEEAKLFSEYIFPTYNNVFLAKDLDIITNLFNFVERDKIISLFENFLSNDDLFHMYLILQTKFFDISQLSNNYQENIKNKFPDLYKKFYPEIETPMKEFPRNWEDDILHDVRITKPYLRLTTDKLNFDLFINLTIFKSEDIITVIETVKGYNIAWPFALYKFAKEIIPSDQLIREMTKCINIERIYYFEHHFMGGNNNPNYKEDFKSFIQKSLPYLNELEPFRICNFVVFAHQYAPEYMKDFSIFEIPECETLDDYIYQLVNNEKFFSPILENIESCESLISLNPCFLMGMSSLASNKSFVDYALTFCVRFEYRPYLSKFFMNHEIKKHFPIIEICNQRSEEAEFLLNYIELTKDEYNLVWMKYNSNAAVFKNPKNTIYCPFKFVFKYALDFHVYECLEFIQLTNENVQEITKKRDVQSMFPLMRNESFRKLCKTQFIINMLNDNNRVVHTDVALIAMNELIFNRKVEISQDKILLWLKYVIKCDKLIEFLQRIEDKLDRSALLELSRRYNYSFALCELNADFDHFDDVDGNTIKQFYEKFPIPQERHIKYLLQVIKHEDSPDIVDYIFSKTKMNVDTFVDKTPLQIAVKYNRPQTVSYLLNKGAKAGYIGECTCLSLTDDEEMKKILHPHADLLENYQYMISTSNDNDVDFLIKCKKYAQANAKIIDEVQKNFESKEFMEYLFIWDVSLEEAFSYLSSMTTQDKILKLCNSDEFACDKRRFYGSVSNDIVSNGTKEFQLCYGVLRRRPQFITPDPRLGNLLYVSIVCGYEEVVSKILECGVDPNEYEGYEHLTNPGLECVRNGKLNLLKPLVSHGLDINRVYYHDNTTLINASIVHKQKDCFDYLLELHCDLSHKVILSPFMAAMSISKTNNYYEMKLLPLIDINQETFFNPKASEIHKN